MPRTIMVGEALGHRMMRASAKEAVIKYLGASDVPASRRRRWYREWCGATSTKLDREDIDRVAPIQSREVQLWLLD